MRWTPGGRSDDLEDRRDDSGGGGFQIGGMHIGIGGFLFLLILSFVFHRNFLALLSTGSAPTGAATHQADPARDASEKHEVEFVSFVLDDAQKTWTQIFSTRNLQYRHAKLVLFRDSIDSACGFAQAVSGPFYCPQDEKVYIDLGFFNELNQRFGAPGEFAQAYVIAHEIGHHVQKQLGIEAKVMQAQQQNPGRRNALSVPLELQADCMAGIWGNSTEQRQLLEKGEAQEALNAAAAVGDDRLQRMSTGHINPDTFTHGSSAERTHWFERGFDTGTLDSCNTFQ